VHAVSGLMLLGGIVLFFFETGSVAFDQIPTDSAAFYLILIGFLINAAVPPLHSWLTDAYPESTITGAIFLSAFTTKTAVYTLIRGYPGTEFLIWLGTVMALWGVVYAVLSNDIRRLLAYSIISQVGYMVAGVGMGTAIALNGAMAHAFAHILYGSVLFMSAGAVMHMTGKSKLTELGGIYKHMPITFVLYMIGGFAISSFPLTSGFVTKTMVIEAAAIDHRAWVWLLLSMASVGTFLYAGLKLPYFAFLGKDITRAGQHDYYKALAYTMRERMAELLTGVAVALRGPQPPLTRWSWHDLPERAAAAVAAIDVMQRAAFMAADPERHNVLWADQLSP
jgi:multicomponent Na+:H+ antiporter subunit D